MKIEWDLVNYFKGKSYGNVEEILRDAHEAVVLVLRKIYGHKAREVGNELKVSPSAISMVEAGAKEKLVGAGIRSELAAS